VIQREKASTDRTQGAMVKAIMRIGALCRQAAKEEQGRNPGETDQQMVVEDTRAVTGKKQRHGTFQGLQYNKRDITLTAVGHNPE
jgi:hypothetical protein